MYCSLSWSQTPANTQEAIRQCLTHVTTKLHVCSLQPVRHLEMYVPVPQTTLKYCTTVYQVANCLLYHSLIQNAIIFYFKLQNICVL